MLWKRDAGGKEGRCTCTEGAALLCSTSAKQSQGQIWEKQVNRTTRVWPDATEIWLRGIMNLGSTEELSKPGQQTPLQLVEFELLLVLQHPTESKTFTNGFGWKTLQKMHSHRLEPEVLHIVGTHPMVENFLSPFYVTPTQLEVFQLW